MTILVTQWLDDQRETKKQHRDSVLPIINDNPDVKQQLVLVFVSTATINLLPQR